jgi:phenylalanyl-tRNA synthetase beta chain
MKLPVSMLLDYVSTSMSAQEIGDLLTMAGFELEGLEQVDGSDVLDIKVVANRGDGLSALGLAREIIAKDASAKPTQLYLDAHTGFSRTEGEPAWKHSIAINTPNCNRYALRRFGAVENGASPSWLADRLTQAGMRSISLLVDLTNYVMLELGQPLHAFDEAKLDGSIQVRQATEGEEFTTLNEVEHMLTEKNMVIADASKAIAVAGVMGGLHSEVDENTKDMLLESAHFDGVSVRKTRKALNLNTDASYRFERSVDPMGVVRALNRFADLYEKITGKTCDAGVYDLFPNKPEPKPVLFRPDRARMIFAMDFSDAECVDYLQKLGCTVTGNDPYMVTPPTWRADLEIEEDLIEEVGRIHGYENIPESKPKGTTPGGGTFGLYSIIDTAKKTMLRCGLDQMISHSLRDQHALDFRPNSRVTVRNPHSPEMAYLRDSLLPGLADAALKNGGKNVALFEIGKVFVKGEVQIDESPELAILVTGEMLAQHYAQPGNVNFDFWALKGIMEELGHLVKDDITFELPRLPDARFHPTRQSGVLVDQGRLWVGTIGQIHPDVAEEIGLPEETYMAEIDLKVFFLNPDAEIKMKSLSRNPAARRDIAFVISKEVRFREIEAALKGACGDLLEEHRLFDIYEGTGIPEGSHSLAISLQLRKIGQNFTDEEANQVRDNAVNAIVSLGGSVR